MEQKESQQKTIPEQQTISEQQQVARQQYVMLTRSIAFDRIHEKVVNELFSQAVEKKVGYVGGPATFKVLCDDKLRFFSEYEIVKKYEENILNADIAKAYELYKLYMQENGITKEEDKNNA